MQANFKRSHVLNLVLVMEAGLLLVATIWARLANIDLMPLLRLDGPRLILIGIAIGVLLAMVSLAISVVARKLKHRISFLAKLEDFVGSTLAPIFAEVNPLDILLIALASGFCEEVFFRGVLQAQFGLVAASIIFGLFHYTGNRYIFYVFWATLAGATLGLFLECFHSLWIPICAHVINNFLSIFMIRYQIGYKRVDTDDNNGSDYFD